MRAPETDFCGVWHSVELRLKTSGLCIVEPGHRHRETASRWIGEIPQVGSSHQTDLSVRAVDRSSAVEKTRKAGLLGERVFIGYFVRKGKFRRNNLGRKTTWHVSGCFSRRSVR